MKGATFYFREDKFDDKYLDRKEFLKNPVLMEDGYLLKFNKSSRTHKKLNEIIKDKGLSKAVEYHSATVTVRLDVFFRGYVQWFFYENEWYLMNDGNGIIDGVIHPDIYEINTKEYYQAMTELKSQKKES